MPKSKANTLSPKSKPNTLSLQTSNCQEPVSPKPSVTFNDAVCSTGIELDQERLEFEARVRRNGERVRQAMEAVAPPKTKIRSISNKSVLVYRNSVMYWEEHSNKAKWMPFVRNVNTNGEPELKVDWAAYFRSKWK